MMHAQMCHHCQKYEITSVKFNYVLILLQNPLYYFIRDHRLHHKYSETDADPHNAKRGFVFSHIAWLFMRRHPECRRGSKEVNMSDIEADPVVMFQKK